MIDLIIIYFIIDFYKFFITFNCFFVLQFLVIPSQDYISLINLRPKLHLFSNNLYSFMLFINQQRYPLQRNYISFYSLYHEDTLVDYYNFNYDS